MKIRIQPRVKADKLRINVTEKRLFVCRSCENKYYSIHFFCPECLGEVHIEQKQPVDLLLISFPPEKKDELVELLTFFTRFKDRDFSRSLRSLPWYVIRGSDVSIVEQWKEMLEPARAQMEIRETFTGWRRGKAPLYESDAPLPQLIPTALHAGIRDVAKNLGKHPLGLLWVEAVLSAFRLLEGFYKKNTTDRIIFPDYAPRIEEELEHVVLVFKDTSRRPMLEKQIESLRLSLESMTAEIEEVKRRIEQEL